MKSRSENVRILATNFSEEFLCSDVIKVLHMFLIEKYLAKVQWKHFFDISNITEIENVIVLSFECPDIF